jgi:hypothetical protein
VADLPTFRKPQQPPKTPEDRILVWKKLFSVRERLYIEPGEVTSLMHMFYVPKGSKDIRMVYNGTASGVNDCLFWPHFSLPTIQQASRALAEGYYQADMDMGEMFLNFILGKKLRPYSGVDVTHIRTTKADLQHFEPEPLTDIPDWEKERLRAWERWGRNWMGMIDSPGRSVQLIIVAKELVLGDRRREDNPFRWFGVILNLPATPRYRPAMPWVYKSRRDGLIANDCFLYVDDNKMTGPTALDCWRGASRFSSGLTHLGIQDAKRKRTSPTLNPGPWAGSVLHTEGGLHALSSAKQWSKAKELIKEAIELLDARDDGLLPHHQLLQIRGFLVYVSRLYPWMPPYLKGMHLTVEAWRPGRDKDGYKLKESELRERPHIVWDWSADRWMDLTEEEYAELTGEKVKPPELVRPVERL